MTNRKGSKTVGGVIRANRIRLGLSVERLAIAAKMTAAYVADIETGVKPLTDSSLVKLSRGLGIPVEWLERRIERAKRKAVAA